ncbi:MAG: chitobiase/beta-hexosaminidase C-terminal domain-containing protein [Bacteroidaceae bacterium]|nr:chitobiase/beta-hexosaminidase C-terminal domain-containing protein [Bacteroidaceae bacterium]
MKKYLLSIFCLFCLAGSAIAENLTIAAEYASSNHEHTATTASVGAPVFSVEAGTKYNPFSVEITAEEGATVYYTLDGTEPTTQSTVYSKAISFNKFNTSTTLKAIATIAGKSSSVTTATYSLKVAEPTFSIKGGVYEKLDGATALKFTCETEGATIYYNDRNGDPITAGSKSYGSLSILSTKEIKAVAFVNVNGNKIYSDVVSEKYHISHIKPYKKATEFTAGRYLISAEGIIAQPVSETTDNEYLQPQSVTVNGDFIETFEFYAFKFTEVKGGYTIQDTLGRYVHLKDTEQTFFVSEAQPTEAPLWTVFIDNETGEATITNVEKNKHIRFSSQQNSFGSYDNTPSDSHLPTLYKLGEYPTFTVTPANGDTIAAFEKVTITCESGISLNEDKNPYYSIDWDYAKYGFDNKTIIDDNTIEFTFDEPITDNKDFRVVFPEGLFILDPNGLAKPSTMAKYTYTVKNINILEVIYANPDNGSSISNIEYLYFEYSQDIIKNANGAVITDQNGKEYPLTVSETDAWGEKAAANTLCLKTAEPITEAGIYTFVLKKEYVHSASNVRLSEDKTYTFTVTGTLNITSITPVVESGAVNEILIEFNKDITCWTDRFLVMSENGAEYYFTVTYTDKNNNELPYNSLRLVTTTPITAAGTYALNIEENTIATTDLTAPERLPAQTFIFTFDGNSITADISEVKGEPAQNGEIGTIYDLTGRKVVNITKPGIYIVDSKKILVK